MSNKLKTFVKILFIVGIPLTVFLIWLSLQRDMSFNDTVYFDYDYSKQEYVCAMNYRNRAVLMRIGEDSKLRKVNVISEKKTSGYKVKSLIIDNKGKPVVLTEKSDSQGTRITLVRLDDNNRVEALSSAYYLDPDYSSVSIMDEGNYYSITALNDDRTQARAYIVQRSALDGGSDKNSSTGSSSTSNVYEKAQSLSSFLSPAGKTIGYAYYSNGAFTVREDTDPPLNSEAIKKFGGILSNVKLNLPQKFITAGDGAKALFLLMLIVIAFLFFLFIFLSRRNRFFTTLFTSLVFIGMAMEAVLIFLNMANNEVFSKAADESYIKRVETVESLIVQSVGGIGNGPFDDNFYSSAAYDGIRNSLDDAKDHFSESGVETH